MADQSDVEKAFVAQCALALGFGSGYAPGAFQTYSGTPVVIYRGWPTDTQLYQDVLAGKAHISVFADGGMTRNTTRFPPDYQTQTGTAPTITATATGANLAVGGTVTAGNVVGVRFGPTGGGAAYATAVVTGDTLSTIAARLAAQIPGATATGATITLPSSLNVTPATMNPVPVLREVRRQVQAFRLSFWAPTPTVRDTLVSAVDAQFAGLLDTSGNLTEFVSVNATDTARIRWHNTYTNDMVSRDRVWRRDLCYSAEYPTTIIEQDPSMLFSGGAGNLGNGGTVQIGNSAPP